MELILFAAVAQAGANQSEDISYDFKVGNLVGAPSVAQTYGWIIGSLFGALISCSMYKLYASQYTIPGPLFRVPSSFLVLSTARLVMGQGLPEGVAPFVLGAAILSALVTIIKMRYQTRWWQKLIPSGVSFAIGTQTLMLHLAILTIFQEFTTCHPLPSCVPLGGFSAEHINEKLKDENATSWYLQMG